MDKVIKLNSKQGGPFIKNTTNNLLDFDIPPDGTYDLSDSYINLVGIVNGMASVIAADLTATVTGFPSAFKVAVNHTDVDRSVYNVAMVKNCSMSSELQGSLEDIRRVDILRQNLNEYTLTTDEKLSLEYQSLRQLKKSNTARSSIFQEIHNEGTVLSRNVSGMIPIKLSQLFELGKLQAYPAQNMGRTRIHCELNLNNFAVANSQDISGDGYTKYEDVAGADLGVQVAISKAKYDNNIENSPHFVGGLTTVKFTSNADNTADDALATAAANPVGTNGALTLVANHNNLIAGGLVKIKITPSADETGRTFTIVGKNNNGNPVQEDLAGGAGAVTSAQSYASITSISIDGASTGTLTVGATAEAGEQTVNRVITGISYAADTGVQTLTFFSPIVNLLAAGKTLTGVVVTPTAADPASASLDISRAELVLRKVAQPPKAPSQLNYMSFSTEQFSGNQETSFQRMFTLEPEAVNVLMMFPKNDLFSQNTDLQNYRLRLDNEDLTNRNIQIDSNNPRDPLYYDRLSMTLLNAGYPTANLQEQNLANDQDPSDGGANQSNYQLTLIANPVPQTPTDKQLQVNLTAGGTGLKEMAIFKQVVRGINI